MNTEATRSLSRRLATTVDRVSVAIGVGTVRWSEEPPLREGAIQTRRPRRLGPILLFLTLVLTPPAGMLVYALMTPWPLYTSEASFAVRNRDGRSSVTSGLGNVIANLGVGLASGNDAYVIRDYLQSHDMLSLLENRISFKTLMVAPRGDLWTRLSSEATSDDTLGYFRSMATVKLSTIEQIISIKSRAFTPDDAQRIAREMIAAAEVFVNKLNQRASEDFLNFALSAVEKAEQRVSETRLAVNQWRNSNASVDPARQFDMLLSIITGLENELSKTRAEISEAQGQRNAAVFEPRLRTLRAKEEALKTQIAEERGRLTGRDSTVADQLLSYERLNIERDLAEKSYTSAVQSLEAARQEASQQQKYIVNISAPSRPENRSFPLPVFHTMVTSIAGLVLWGIALLVGAVIRDYRIP